MKKYDRYYLAMDYSENYIEKVKIFMKEHKERHAIFKTMLDAEVVVPDNTFCNVFMRDERKTDENDSLLVHGNRTVYNSVTKLNILFNFLLEGGRTYDNIQCDFFYNDRMDCPGPCYVRMLNVKTHFVICMKSYGLHFCKETRFDREPIEEFNVYYGYDDMHVLNQCYFIRSASVDLCFMDIYTSISKMDTDKSCAIATCQQIMKMALMYHGALPSTSFVVDNHSYVLSWENRMKITYEKVNDRTVLLVPEMSIDMLIPRNQAFIFVDFYLRFASRYWDNRNIVMRVTECDANSEPATLLKVLRRKSSSIQRAIAKDLKYKNA